MNRAELLLMKDERLADARVSLAGGRSAVAYYVTAYAVECALKSCVLARMIYTGAVFADKVPDFKVHKFEDLVKLAGLQAELATGKAANPAFAANWAVVIQWTSTTRYRTVALAGSGLSVGAA